MKTPSKTEKKEEAKRSKYIFVIGGVISGVGKGITTSSIAMLLQARGYRVSPIKFDPYLNVDAGTMNPVEHGEVFVLNSGLETDQDMGNYERYLGVELPAENYMTNGMIYKTIIDRERSLGYNGKCVEPVYNVTEEILRRIQVSVDVMQPDITIVEIGGIVDEYQNAVFIEAARILKSRNPEDVMFVVVSYLPIPKTAGEMKTRPTQNAVRSLSHYGVNADMIVARASRPLHDERKAKIAFATNVPKERIISAPDVNNIYEIPINYEKEGVADSILGVLKLPAKNAGAKSGAGKITLWKKFIKDIAEAKDEVRIAIIGKYFKVGDDMQGDVYISVIDSLKHAAAHLHRKVVIDWLDASDFDPSSTERSLPEIKKSLAALVDYDGILVPGGFGKRGVEGKMNVIKFARENKLPYFGLCYGMQLLVVEYARNVLGMKDAHTTEIEKRTAHRVVDIMPEQMKNLQLERFGGSMRLGAYPCKLAKGTIAHDCYKKPEVSERHRHRYEVNPDFVKEFEEGGLVFSGKSPDGRLMEIAELPKDKHPFMLGTQFHPEFKTSPLAPHPLFRGFLAAAVEYKDKRRK